MADARVIELRTNEAEFNAALREYVQNTRKTPAEAISAKARDVGWALFRTYGAGVQANAALVVASARARGWATRRRGDSIAPAEPGGRVSRAAMRRALSLLAGEKSGFFSIKPGNNGTVVIQQARFGKRGKLLKNSTGKRGATARKFGELSGKEQTKAEEAGGFSRLNAPALAAATEVAYRARAARGGSMRAQWLPPEWKKGRKTTAPGSQLYVKNRGGKSIGTVSVTENQVTLSAGIANTGPVGTRTGAIARAFGIVRDDMMKYLRDRAEKARKRAQERANRPPRIIAPKLP